MSPSKLSMDVASVVKLAIHCGGMTYGNHVCLTNENLLRFYEAAAAEQTAKVVSSGLSVRPKGRD